MAVETKHEFLMRVEGRIEDEFNKDSGEHESWEDLYCWLAALMRSDDIAELSRKDQARVILAGLPKIDVGEAASYMGDQYDSKIGNDDPALDQEGINDVYDRIIGLLGEDE